METIKLGDKNLIISGMTNKDLKCVKEYQNFINSLIEEDVKILMNKKQSIKDELEFIKSAVKKVKEKKKVYVIVRDGNKIVANTGIELQTYKRSHIGKFGIAIRNGYRGIGLGKYVMAEVMKRAKTELKPTPKIFQLEVYENNKPAIALYKKMGFKIVAKLPKQIQYKGKLIAEYVMQKPVK